MNIGIDIDDTITNTLEILIPYVSKNSALDIGKLKESNKMSYDKILEQYKDKIKEIGKVMFEQVLPNVTLKEDAKEIIDKLKYEGNKIIIITARDKAFYDKAFEFTSNQLNNLGINYDKLFCTYNKRQVCIDEKIDLFIDDNIKNLDSVKGIVDSVLLFNSKIPNNYSSLFILNSYKYDTIHFIRAKESNKFILPELFLANFLLLKLSNLAL